MNFDSNIESETNQRLDESSKTRLFSKMNLNAFQ